MNDKLKYAQLDAANNLDWCFHVGCDGSVEFEKYSPLGENFLFSVEGKDLAKEVRQYYEDYDPDEHCKELIRSGVRGLPRDVEALARDAHKIDDMLCELMDAISDVEVGEDD